MKFPIYLLALLCAVLALLVCSPEAEASNRGRAFFNQRGNVVRQQVVIRNNALRQDQFGRVFLNGVPVHGAAFVQPLFVQPLGVQQFRLQSFGGSCR